MMQKANLVKLSSGWHVPSNIISYIFPFFFNTEFFCVKVIYIKQKLELIKTFNMSGTA